MAQFDDLNERFATLEAYASESVTQLNDLMDEHSERASQLDGQVRAIEQNLAQMAGTYAEVHRALQENHANMVALKQQLDVLARAQVQVNTRAMSLQLAIQGKNEQAGPREITAHAEEYWRFIVRDFAPQPAPDTSDGPTAEQVPIDVPRRTH